MSGSAGGNRILRKDVEKTVKDYTNNVLTKNQYFKNCLISGSYNYSDKKDFGDIDLLIYMSESSKKDFIEFLMLFSEDIIVPFKSEKYKGKRYYNSGEIVTILYPIPDKSNEFVQIDNIFCYTPKELAFKYNFLNLPAIKQGLLLGLVKIEIIEHPNKYLFFNRKILPKINKNQEFEFNLSSSALTLRIVTLGENYKTMEKYDYWHASDWEYVKPIMNRFDFSKPFELLLNDIASSLKNPRSINRIKGIFKSMVSVKSGELNTEKGIEKQNALNIISKL